MLHEKYAKEIENSSFQLIDSPELRVVSLTVAVQKLQLLEASLKQKIADRIMNEAQNTQFSYQAEIDDNGVANIVGEAKEGSVVSLQKVLEILHII